MKALLLIIISLHSGGLSAQTQKFVTVKAGSNIMDVLSASDVLYYPVFTQAKLVFRDGTTAEAKLNYNRLVDEMHFISAAGDTLALSNEENIKYIAVDKDTFYFDRGGYLRIIEDNGRAKLALKQIWTVHDSRQIGAYNTSNSSAAITSFTNYTEGGKLYNLTVNVDIILKQVERFFVGNNSNRFYPATKKNILMLFTEWQTIEGYLKRNKPDFTSQADLIKLMNYIAQLN